MILVNELIKDIKLIANKNTDVKSNKFFRTIINLYNLLFLLPNKTQEIY